MPLINEPEYVAWRGMRQRCNSPTCKSFKDYGGRGIKVDARWDNSYPQFLADMGRKPSALYTIERTDNDGNYEPGNCIWALRDVQGRNRRCVRVIEFAGRSGTLVDWASRVGIKYRTLHARLSVYGWTVERALTEGAAPWAR